jgi:hypothetical protein
LTNNVPVPPLPPRGGKAPLLDKEGIAQAGVVV